MASMIMIPSEVLTAQDEYSVIPTKYRLSKTFTGSACHRERSGGPGGCAAPRWPRSGAATGSGALHKANKAVCSCLAAAFAAATCDSGVCLLDWLNPISAPSSPVVSTKTVALDFMLDPLR